jgi:Protein of unknown function (DUF3768)
VACSCRFVLTLLSGDVDLRRALAAQNAGEHQQLTDHRAPSSRQVPVQRRRRDAEALRNLFKIDYYDASMEFGSEDLADLSKTTRVLTIMLAEDWRGGLLLAGFRGGFSKTTPKLLLLIWEHRKEKQPHIGFSVGGSSDGAFSTTVPSSQRYQLHISIPVTSPFSSKPRVPASCRTCGWQHLGNRFGIKRPCDFDCLSPNLQGHVVSAGSAGNVGYF